MEVSVFNLIALRQLPTGRRRFALRQVKRALQTLQTSSNPVAPAALADVLAACDRALDHDDKAAQMRATWAQHRREASNSQGLSQARVLDGLIDRTISGIDGKLVSESMTYPANSPEAQQIESLRAFLLPTGVIGIASASHVESLHLIAGLLQRAQERSQELANVGAANLISRLQGLFAEFKALLDAEKTQSVSSNDVRAAEREGNRLLRNVVVLCLHLTLEKEDPTLMALRQTLLGPILTQNAAAQRASRANRRTSDVSPESGDEIATDDDLDDLADGFEAVA